jgi:predicted nucleotidyltransferase
MNNIQSIQNKIVPILKQANIKKAALFGSYARGDNTEKSDIDILIAFPENATLLDLVRLQRHLEENLSKKVDIVSYNAISPLIKDSILRYQYPLL